MVKAKINWLVYTSTVKFQSSPADVFPSPVQQDSESWVLPEPQTSMQRQLF